MPVILALLSAAEVGEGERAIQPALSTLAQTVLGSLAIISFVIAGIAIWQLIKVQNARVLDSRESNKQNAELVEKMTLAFAEMKSTLEGLRQSEEKGQLLMSSMKTTLDVMLAMRQFRPTPQAMPAVREDPKVGRR